MLWTALTRLGEVFFWLSAASVVAGEVLLWRVRRQKGRTLRRS